MRPEIYSSLLLVVTLRRERGRDPGRGDRGDLQIADREVALKMILAGRWASEAEVQRFRLEAQGSSLPCQW
jgi:hypothetical protein